MLLSLSLSQTHTHTHRHTHILLLLLVAWRYNSGRVLAFSTIPFHLRRSWTWSVHFMSFIFFKSFLTSSSHQDLGPPTGLPVNGLHLCIFFTILVSGILFMCPKQLNLVYVYSRRNLYGADVH